ncbi:MAG: LytTR family DNA-binding domain-containing protein [Eubacteriales bacterium]|nr:LytTR family DNA-binding domain-containing protein [Eubacteriales bacterium]
MPQVQSALRQLCFECDVLCYESGEALLKDIRSGKKPSILLLDVMLDRLDGMTLARELRKDAVQIPVIFVSSNRDCALYGYELEALRFLAKPVEEERLLEALKAAIQKQQAQTIVIQTVDGLSRLEVCQIRYVEMLRRGVQFFLRDGTVLPTRLKISDIEQELPKQRFFRCHQGYIVSLDAISTLVRSDAVLENGQHIPVSRYRLADLRERFLNYLHDA